MLTLSPRAIAIDTIVFDFDGTLAELRLDFSEMKRRLAQLAEPFLGYRPEPGTLPALEWLSVLAGEVRPRDGSNGEGLVRAGQALILEMEMEAARQGRLFHYVRHMLNGLRRSGIRLAIITRNCQPAVATTFPDWSCHCDCLLTRDQVAVVKPDPDHLLQALDALRSSPNRSLMVGDHPMDIETGRRAGTWTAAVASGNVSKRELAASEPDWVACDCDELIRTLAGRMILVSQPGHQAVESLPPCSGGRLPSRPRQ